MEINGQNLQIYKYLKEGNRLTSLDAMRRFGCTRLASRIYDIKQRYLEKKEYVADMWIEKQGKRFKEYSINLLQ
jgi:hypothetical protein